MAGGFEFSSPEAEALWQLLAGELGILSDWDPLGAPYGNWFRDAGSTLLRAFELNWDPDHRDLQKFQAQLGTLGWLLGTWESLRKQADGIAPDGDRATLVAWSSETARELVQLLNENAQLRRVLTSRDIKRSAGQANEVFSDQVRRLAENIIVDLECWTSGREAFVRTAWRLDAMTRGSGARPSSTGDIPELYKEWLAVAWEFWRTTTKDGTIENPALDAVMEAARRLETGVTELARAIEHSMTTELELQRLFEELERQAAEVASAIGEAPSRRGFGRMPTLQALGPGLAGLLGEATAALGRRVGAAGYAPPAAPGVGAGTGGSSVGSVGEISGGEGTGSGVGVIGGEATTSGEGTSRGEGTISGEGTHTGEGSHTGAPGDLPHAGGEETHADPPGGLPHVEPFGPGFEHPFRR